MTDAYADPWRERGQWWGDAYVDDHINQVAFGDHELLRRGIRLMSEAFSSGRPEALAPNGDGNYMLDYGMLWVESVHDYWRQTGDPDVPREVLGSIDAFMRYLATYEDPDTGLMDIPFAHWSQTVYVEPAGYSNRYGQSTAVNAMYYGTLLNAARLAGVTGDTTLEAAWRQKAAAVRQRINRYLYRHDQQRYLTSIRDGQPVAPSPHAQAWALAFGVVPPNRVEPVAGALLHLLSPDPSRPNIEIYGMFWVLEALGRSERIPDALRIIERYYGHMLDRGATTWWEGFNADRYYSGSLSHGWGGAPTWFLTTYVLGARRTGPNRWTIRQPKLGPGAVAGEMLLSHGDLQVRWESDGCALQRLMLTAPDETSGVVTIPRPDSSLVLTLDGTVVWQEGASLNDDIRSTPEGVELSLAAGQHILQVNRTCYSTYAPVVMR
jgi:alpha-L-rhamnosidase